jgi:D-tagatose-1,6-bisphosphate aldolase subunit GatZ/KbaZ
MWLDKVISAQKRGEAKGITSICSANAYVIRAAIQQAARTGAQVLVEATCNQVNQFGGYTGMRPVDFAAFLDGIRSAAGLSPGRLLLGADHLGPFPWRGEPAAQAMRKACELAAECVRAGYLKLHLDASMPLGGDAPDARGGLDPELVARREAELAAAAEAEAAFQARSPAGRPAGGVGLMYVVGTDVPAPEARPGGEEACRSPRRGSCSAR